MEQCDRREAHASWKIVVLEQSIRKLRAEVETLRARLAKLEKKEVTCFGCSGPMAKAFEGPGGHLICESCMEQIKREE